MPQMMPINWLFSFVFFLLIYLIFNIMNYYIYNINNCPSKINKTNMMMKNLSWKW